MSTAKQFTGGAVLEFGAVSDPGRVRAANQDAVAIDETGGIALVADGVGGGQCGAQASACVANTVTRVLRRHLLAFAGASINGVVLDDGELESMVRSALLEAHAEVLDAAAGNGMASTVVVLFIHGGCAVLGWVGDSACYRLPASGALVRLTRNHNLAAASGGDDRIKSALTNVVGGTGEVFRPSLLTFPAQTGDLFILCSDGLTDELSDADIAEVVRMGKGKPSLLAQQLVDAANGRGGKDNVSVAVVRTVRAAAGWYDVSAPSPAVRPPSPADGGRASWQGAVAGVVAGIAVGAGAMHFAGKSAAPAYAGKPPEVVVAPAGKSNAAALPAGAQPPVPMAATSLVPAVDTGASERPTPARAPPAKSDAGVLPPAKRQAAGQNKQRTTKAKASAEVHDNQGD